MGDRRLPPEAVWVGRRATPLSDLADRAAHGAAVIDALRDRLPADSAARRALDRAPDSALSELRAALDAALDRTLRPWLDRQSGGADDAVPADAVEAISEHPLPLVRHVAEDPSRPEEVHILGIEG